MELEYPRYPFDFQAIDERYKIADSINLDYRIAASSPLVEGGCGDSSVLISTAIKIGTTRCSL